MERARRQDAGQNFYISFTDLLLGFLFIFIILLVTYALVYKEAERGYREELKEILDVIDARDDLLRRLARKLNANVPRIPAVADIDQGVLRLPEGVLFRRGHADLSPAAQSALIVLRDALAAELPCYGNPAGRAHCTHGRPILEAVYIEGHTDDEPINTRQFPTNWQLSSERAIVTYRFLTDGNRRLKDLKNSSGKARMLGASAYAETRPVRHERYQTENRRIDFRFLLALPSRRNIEKELAR